ncbi:hypothetical protein [Streptomyces sp. NPDC055085]
MNRPDYDAIRDLEAEIYGRPMCECPLIPAAPTGIAKRRHRNATECPNAILDSTSFGGAVTPWMFTCGCTPNQRPVSLEKEPSYVRHGEECTGVKRGQRGRATITAAVPGALVVIYLASVGIAAAVGLIDWIRHG